MSSLQYNVRTVIAALCSLAYLATLPQISPIMLGALMHGGHEVHVVDHDGHQDLVFQHNHADEDHDHASDEQQSLTQNHLEDHHDDHVLRLAYKDMTATLRDALSLAPMVKVCPTEMMPMAASVTWSIMPARSRPPPIIGGGDVLVCLRTTVLVV